MPRKGSCLVMLRGNHDNWVLSQAAGFLFSWNKRTNCEIQLAGYWTQLKKQRAKYQILQLLMNLVTRFKNKLGEGGYGAVYVGILLDGREIAVKKLSDTLTQGI